MLKVFNRNLNVVGIINKKVVEGIMKKLEEFRIEDLSKNPETPETESQDN